jgi:hypothetical protein
MRGAKQVNSLLKRHLGIHVQRVGSGSPNTTSETFADKSEALTGMVEQFDKKGIIGWVSGNTGDFPMKVSLCINGHIVHSTWANVDSELSTTGIVRSFFIGTKGVWKYCKQNDRLTVRVGDKVLPINGVGAFKTPEEDGKSSFKALQNKLAKDYLFNRRGALQLSMKLDVNRQKQMLDLYNEVSSILKKKCDITPFLMYGSLLGQVREGGFIGHDDDFDIAYVSKHRKGADAAKELVKVAKTLQSGGMVVELRATAVHVHNKDNPKLRIDLFHLYFNEDDELSFAFGVAGTKHFMKSDWGDLVKADFAGHPVMIPNNAEKLVECMYGESWRTPIAGFNWNHARTRRDDSSKVSVKTREKFNNN